MTWNMGQESRLLGGVSRWTDYGQHTDIMLKRYRSLHMDDDMLWQSMRNTDGLDMTTGISRLRDVFFKSSYVINQELESPACSLSDMQDRIDKAVQWLSGQKLDAAKLMAMAEGFVCIDTMVADTMLILCSREEQ